MTVNEIVSAYRLTTHTCIRLAHQLDEKLKGCSSDLWAIVFEQGDQVWYDPVDSLVRSESFRNLTKRLESVDFRRFSDAVPYVGRDDIEKQKSGRI